MAIPIWRDTFVTFTDYERAEYQLRDSDGTILYQGVAQARPDEVYAEAKVNEIISDYLTGALPGQPDATNPESKWTQWGQLSTGAVVFSVYLKNTDGDWELFRNLGFKPDWAYDPDAESADATLSTVQSDPIVCRWAEGFPFVQSGYVRGTAALEVEFKDGSKETLKHRLSGFSPDFNRDFNADFQIDTIPYRVEFGFVWWDLSALKDVARITSTVTLPRFDKTYEVAAGCPRYGLYYLNRYGGWDFLVFEGRAKETRAVERSVYSPAGSNAVATNRAEVNYLNSIERNLSLVTGWLPDEAAERMPNLLDSTLVYMWDNREGVLLPVTIEDSEYEIKSYAGSGGRLFNYTVNVKVSREYLRK